MNEPVCPHGTTSNRVSNMTNKWMKEILTLTISTQLDRTEEFHLEAFNKTINWAKSRYKRKFTNSSIDTAKNVLISEPIGNPPLASSPVIPVISKKQSISAQVIQPQDKVLELSDSGLSAPSWVLDITPSPPEGSPTHYSERAPLY